MSRRTASSGSPLEPVIGMSRAVRIGPYVSVAGTAPIAPDGSSACVGDAAGQMRRCLDIVEGALTTLGVSMDDVIRTRILLTDIADWQAVTAVHGERFGTIRPACTVMAVVGFVRPEWLVELEVDAVAPDA